MREQLGIHLTIDEIHKNKKNESHKGDERGK